MKASVICAYGGIDQMKIEHLPLPKPGRDEVRIRIICSSINPFDAARRNGELKLVYPVRFPGTLGLDAAGIVDSVGSAVENLVVGDAVFGSSVPKVSGCHAEYACLLESRLAKLPSYASFAEFGSLPCVALTALQSLRDKAQMQSGARVLVNGASGGVGSVTIQMAKILGAGSVTAVSSTRNEAYCRTLGADGFIDYKKQDFTQVNEQWDVIVDAAARTSYFQCRRALAEKGTYITTVPGINLFLAQFFTALSTHGAEFIIIKPNTADLESIAELVNEGHLKPQVGQEFVLEEIRAAFAALEAGDHRGKIVVRVAPEP